MDIFIHIQRLMTGISMALNVYLYLPKEGRMGVDKRQLFLGQLSFVSIWYLAWYVISRFYFFFFKFNRKFLPTYITTYPMNKERELYRNIL